MKELKDLISVVLVISITAALWIAVPIAGALMGTALAIFVIYVMLQEYREISAEVENKPRKKGKKLK